MVGECNVSTKMDPRNTDTYFDNDDVDEDDPAGPGGDDDDDEDDSLDEIQT